MDRKERVYKVALFGVVDCGKSSIINVLCDEQVAQVSTGADACTRRAQWYPVSLGKMKFRLWDTMGFNQAETSDVNPLSAYEQAHALLRNLPDGIDLVLLCARKDGINASFRRLYWLLDSFFFGGRAQIALVLTHFDTLSEQSEWWDRNCNSIAQRCNISVQFLSHACITTVRDGSSESDTLYQRSKQELEALLEEIDGTTPTPFPPDLSSIAAAPENLSTYCQLSIADATTLVENFRSPKRAFNVVLFGEAGAGKSSIVNLLLGRRAAEVSSNIDNCTLDFASYEIDTGSHQFQVWDTVGLNGMYIGHNVWKGAMENAVRLIRTLHRHGGVDLLVFCKKSGRFSPSELNSFRIFHGFLCEGRIPVAFVITHLEFVTPMEQWWEMNGKELVETCGLKPSAVAGHVCITSLPLEDSNDQRFRDKILLSKQSIQTMLDDSLSYGNVFDKDEGTWVMSFLRKFAGMALRAGNPSRKEKITAKNLVERCGLTKEHAEELIKLFYTRA